MYKKENQGIREYFEYRIASCEHYEHDQMALKLTEIQELYSLLQAAESKLNTDEWHKAVLHECMMTEACYVEADPLQSIKNLVAWHIDNTEFHLHNSNQSLLLKISELESKLNEMAQVEPVGYLIEYNVNGKTEKSLEFNNELSFLEYIDEHGKEHQATKSRPVFLTAGAQSLRG